MSRQSLRLHGAKKQTKCTEDVVCLCVCVGVLVTQSCLTLVTPWTVAYQAPLFMELSRQEYWKGLPLGSQYHIVQDVELEKIA